MRTGCPDRRAITTTQATWRHTRAVADATEVSERDRSRWRSDRRASRPRAGYRPSVRRDRASSSRGCRPGERRDGRRAQTVAPERHRQRRHRRCGSHERPGHDTPTTPMAISPTVPADTRRVDGAPAVGTAGGNADGRSVTGHHAAISASVMARFDTWVPAQERRRRGGRTQALHRPGLRGPGSRTDARGGRLSSACRCLSTTVPTNPPSTSPNHSRKPSRKPEPAALPELGPAEARSWTRR